ALGERDEHLAPTGERFLHELDRLSAAALAAQVVGRPVRVDRRAVDDLPGRHPEGRRRLRNHVVAQDPAGRVRVTPGPDYEVPRDLPRAQDSPRIAEPIEHALLA